MEHLTEDLGVATTPTRSAVAPVGRRASERLVQRAALGLVALALFFGLALAGPGARAAASPPSAAVSPRGTPPPGFTPRYARVGELKIHYVIGGKGSPLVMLHGWPQDWSEFKAEMPTLAKSHTVVAIDLPGAGRSGLSRSGYDGETVARQLHRLLTKLGLARGVDIVAHDIGIWAAYPYAALYPGEVRRLVAMDASIPDQSFFAPPAVNPSGPSVWHHGFFQEPFAEQLIAGHEGALVRGFIGQFLAVRDAFGAADYRYLTDLLRRPGRVHAWMEYYRAVRSDDVRQNRRLLARGKLTLPVLAIGAESGVGQAVPDQWKAYATDVTGRVLEGTGHWLTEERPGEVTALIDGFLRR